MADLQDSWKEVASKAEALGLKLKLHLEQEEGEQEEGATEDESSTSSDARAAIENLGHRLGDAFDSIGAATKDPAVRADVKEIGTLLKEALADTFSTVSTEVGEAMKKASGRSGQAAAPDPGDADEAGAEPTS